MARSQTAPGHGLTALGASEIQSPLSQLIPSFFHLPLHLNQNKKTPLSLSQGENNLSWGKALPFDLGPTEGIPGLTATSSSIPSGYFIDFSSLSPWILLPRVHNIKDEDSILDHGFIGLMVGIVL
jgi:hypothetical protein